MCIRDRYGHDKAIVRRVAERHQVEAVAGRHLREAALAHGAPLPPALLPHA